MKYLLLVLVFISKIMMAQEFKDSLYLNLYNYQIIKDELAPGEINLNELNKSFYIVDLAENTNSDSFAIYKFYNLKRSEPSTSLFIIDGNNIEIYDILSFNIIINKIFNLNVFDEKKKIILVKEILKVYEDYNKNILSSAIMTKQYGRYKYFIPLKNFRKTNGVIEK